MSNNEFVPMLGMFTLIAGLLIAIVLLVRFLRKPSNRHLMDGQRERNIGEIREDAGEGRDVRDTTGFPR
ncbi:MAG: hypothetical protein K2X31_06805 [Sphingopyxis sp.]|nr:hypothetical protein [Sphingopyxis sp.]